MLSVYSFCSCIFSLADILSHPRLPDETYRLLNLGKRQWEPHRPCELPEGIYGSVPVKRSGRFLPRWCTISGPLIWNLNVTAWKRCSAVAWYNNSYIMLVKNCRIYLFANKAIFLFLFQVRMRSTGWHRTAGLLFLWMATMSGVIVWMWLGTLRSLTYQTSFRWVPSLQLDGDYWTRDPDLRVRAVVSLWSSFHVCWRRWPQVHPSSSPILPSEAGWKYDYNPDPLITICWKHWLQATRTYYAIIQGSVTSVHPVWCDAINDLLVEREEEVRKFTR